MSSLLFVLGQKEKNEAKVAEGMALGARTHAQKIRVLGSDHPSTLIAAMHLGNNLGILTRYEEALPLLRKTLPVATRVFGNETPRTLEVTSNLVVHQLAHCVETPEANNKTLEKEMLKLGDKTLAIFQRVLGRSNPQTLRLDQALRARCSFLFSAPWILPSTLDSVNPRLNQALRAWCSFSLAASWILPLALGFCQALRARCSFLRHKFALGKLFWNPDVCWG
jgi:hypothetical protein